MATGNTGNITPLARCRPLRAETHPGSRTSAHHRCQVPVDGYPRAGGREIRCRRRSRGRTGAVSTMKTPWHFMIRKWAARGGAARPGRAHLGASGPPGPSWPRLTDARRRHWNPPAASAGRIFRVRRRSRRPAGARRQSLGARRRAGAVHARRHSPHARGNRTSDPARIESAPRPRYVAGAVSLARGSRGAPRRSVAQRLRRAVVSAMRRIALLTTPAPAGRRRTPIHS